MIIREQEKIDNYYKALVERDSTYVGIFFVGVRTTLVFCIATCRARKPKKENVEFYTSFKEALKYGYRPCKICNPTQNTHTPPAEVEQAIHMVKNNPKKKIKDYQLRQNNISPEKLRRWFKKHYGLTFHAYQRMYRVNNAYKELKDGKKTTDTAYDIGYESLSGFAYTYKKIIGSSPNDSKSKNVILINRLTTPLGPMFICSTDKGLCLLEFTDRKMLETEFKDLQKRLDASIIIGENEHTKRGKKELAEYFDGTRKKFDVILDTPGTDYQNKVWRTLESIAYGNTTHYQALAESMGNPTSTRAVASANGHNRISIIVPCHRVIGKDGSLTGYGGGLERKQWLLDFEQEKNLI
jgi:AraC family transcriptional regulator of adaptative response/methylated-DNA-[protein]-cysteine methyltransferase